MVDGVPALLVRELHQCSPRVRRQREVSFENAFDVRALDVRELAIGVGDVEKQHARRQVHWID